MQFVALGISKDFSLNEMDSIKSLAAAYDIDLIPLSADKLDIEIRDGVSDFSSYLSLSVIQLIKLSTAKKNKTSSDVVENLVDFFFGKAEPDMLNFLIKCKNLLPDKFYLIFAFEWYKDEKVMYKEREIDRLKQFFTDNCSWNFRLYDYKRREYDLDLDLPLIIEVQNNKRLYNIGN